MIMNPMLFKKNLNDLSRLEKGTSDTAVIINSKSFLRICSLLTINDFKLQRFVSPSNTSEANPHNAYPPCASIPGQPPNPPSQVWHLCIHLAVSLNISGLKVFVNFATDRAQ